MKTINVSEATGPALDWLVAKIEGELEAFEERETCADSPCFYSEDWSQGGPIIEREEIAIVPMLEGWQAQFELDDEKFFLEYLHLQYGPTPLIAAMRCHVVSKLGKTVEVPEELI